MRFPALAVAATILGSVSSFAFAQTANFTVNGSVPVVIKVTPPDLSKTNALKNYSAEELTGYKTISLLNVQLSPEALAQLKSSPAGSGEPDYKDGIIPFSKSAGAVDLGMNNVPVLDQGQYGTCVTFSTTAALDAVIGKGNYISQQCSLELDAIDTADDTYPNDPLGGNYWNGAYYGTQVANPLLKKGVIQKGKCFGSTYANPSAKLTSLAQYTAASDTASVSKITSVYHGHDQFSLDTLKTALKAGHRVAFSSLIGPNVEGYNVTMKGSSQKTGGLWACQQASQDASNNCNGNYAGGHEIVVIGFDDAQQLLKIRNSWNTVVGDNGDYYMTYAYFNYWSTGAGRYGDGTELY